MLVALAAAATAPSASAQGTAITLPPVGAVAELAQAEALIEALVQRGLLTRARAEVLKREAQQRAGIVPQVAATPPAPAHRVAKASTVPPTVAPATAAPAPAPSPTVAVAAAAPTPAPSPAPSPAPAPTVVAEAPAPAVQRVPYVPQPVREQLRAQLREDLLAVARNEQWGAPANAATANASGGVGPGAWAQRVTVEGDMRLRWQQDHAADANLAATDYVLAATSGVTRAADFASANAAGSALGNTQADRERWRIRARLAVNARIADNVTAGLRLATGSATDRVSTNQTLGQNANRYTFLLDRAFLRWDPAPWLSFQGGRIANPFLATEAQFSENLNFEGVSTLWRWPAAGGRTFEPWLVAGYFPIREDNPAAAASRSLVAVQGGMTFDLPRVRMRLGLARYQYRNLEGRIDADYSLATGAGPSYGQHEYGAALRQRGNTLVLTNNPLERSGQGPGGTTFTFTPDRWRWGLASRFTPVALTAAAEFSHFAPLTLAVSAEAIQNTAYDRAEILARTGVRLSDGSDKGLSVRALFGHSALRQKGHWQANIAWRKVGSDAVLDAFTDGDLRGGGSNVVGWSLGGQYALERDLVLGLRWLSGRQIDSMSGQATGRDGQRPGYALDSIQVDLGARF